MYRALLIHAHLYRIVWINLSKRGGMDGVFRGLAGFSEGFPKGEARWKSRGAALSAWGKPRPLPPSQLFYSDLHYILNTFFYFPNSRKMRSRNIFFARLIWDPSDAKEQIWEQPNFCEFFVRNIFTI